MDLSLNTKKGIQENQQKIKSTYRKKLWWEIPLGVFIGLALVTGGLLGYKTFAATKKVITENISGSAPALLDNVEPRELKGEGDGRINILLLGWGGEGHNGSFLTDTIMVVSIDPKTKKVAMLSIPRDLYLYIPKEGYNRINTMYWIGEKRNKNGGGISMSKEVVSDLLDLNIHYAIAVDFDGFKDIVNALGGVTVDVEKDLVDYQYPTSSGGYQTLRIKKGTQKMDGELALKYARSRKSTSDYDRAARQQILLAAIRDKALKVETILNPTKVSGLIEVLGNHLKTDIQLWEIQRLVEMSKDIDMSNMVNKVISVEEGIVAGKMINGMSVVVPKSGDYGDIRKFAHEVFTDSFLTGENASIDILNGTKNSNSAKRLSMVLESYNYNIKEIKNAERQDYKNTIIYDNTESKKPYTIEFLKKRLSKLGIKAEVKKGTMGSSEADIIIIVGSDYRG